MDMNIENFDPDAPGIANGRYFGLPFEPAECALVLMSVPWDVTTSYGAGAADGPGAMIEASLQIDLHEPLDPDGWRKGIGTLDVDPAIRERSERLRPLAREQVARVNEASRALNDRVHAAASEWLTRGKLVGLVGGDHSTPLGLMRAVAEQHPGVGILHIDAHADLREAYEGFEHSHASIMYNALNIKEVAQLTQVAIRDFCTEELTRARADQRVKQFTDYELQTALYQGETWHAMCQKIIHSLPEKVYVSFDIDGLDPALCPHTGTPVPGGLGFDQAVYLLESVVVSGRRIVGFDLTEVASGPDEWDANVGARMLYKLCNLALR